MLNDRNAVKYEGRDQHAMRFGSGAFHLGMDRISSLYIHIYIYIYIGIRSCCLIKGMWYGRKESCKVCRQRLEWISVLLYTSNLRSDFRFSISVKPVSDRLSDRLSDIRPAIRYPVRNMTGYPAGFSIQCSV